MRRKLSAVLAGVCVIGVACATSTEDTSPSRTGAGGAGGEGLWMCVAEMCDGFDNDCDGFVDEGCPCEDGQEQECYSGNPVSVDVGVCERGSQQCTGGTWGPCLGDVKPAREVCDGLDNDCDGVLDDDCGAGGAGGGTYAQAEILLEPTPAEDVRGIELVAKPGEEVSLQVEFSWQQQAGRPPLFDLALRSPGATESLVQVFSFRGKPLVRVGSRAQPLEPQVDYRIEVSRNDVGLRWKVVRAGDGREIIRGPVGTAVRTSTRAVELVTPQVGSRVELGPPRISHRPTGQ